MRGKSIVRRALYLFIGTLVILLIVEIILQGASFFINHKLNQRFLSLKTASFHRKGDSLPIEVLCVGDSFTQGVGASELAYSYPMQLQDYFHKKSTLSWAVVNCGKAGTNSSELVQYLPRLFEMYSPRYLCVLIGVNDSWNFDCRSKKDRDEPSTTEVVPWRFCFRTYRLFCMIKKYFMDICESRKYLNSISYVKSQNDHRVPMRNNTDLNSDQLLKYAEELLSAERFSEASEVLRKIVRQYSGHHDVNGLEVLLANTLVELKRMEEAYEYACDVKKRISNQPSPCHDALAWLFMRLCKFDLAYNEIEQYEKFFPESRAEINTLLGNYYFETYRYSEAEAYFLKAIENNPKAPFVMRTLARIYSFNEHKLHDAKRLLMRAYAMDKDRKMTELYLGIVDSAAAEKFPEVLKQAIDIPEMDQQSFEEFIKISKEFVKRRGGGETLKANLSVIVSLCAKYGVAPLLITYPSPTEINSVIRKFCLDNRILMFDAEAMFHSLLQREALDKYLL